MKRIWKSTFGNAKDKPSIKGKRTQRGKGSPKAKESQKHKKICATTRDKLEMGRQTLERAR